MRRRKAHRRRRPARRGSAYVAVLGASLVVATIGLSAMAITRAQRMVVINQTDVTSARLLTQATIEWGAQAIASEPNWRTSRSNGIWLSNQSVLGATVTLEATDPDGSLGNRPTDPLTMKATVARGRAKQILQADFAAAGPPFACVKMAIHTGGQLRVQSGATLTATGAPVSTNGALRNDATINGNVLCGSVHTLGTVNGTLTVGVPSKPMPPSSVVSLYANLGTAISPGSSIDKKVITPGVNQVGATNPDGVYVISTSSNLTIRNTRLHGTLVILCPGKTVTIDSSVLLENFRADYPVLIVDGNLELKFAGASSLSESDTGTNFNPAGAPFEGAADGDQADLYPSEIRGLVHVRGTVLLDSTCRVRGAVIADSTASPSVTVQGAPEIIYNPALTTAPTMGYMQYVTMSVVPGSWKQVVLQP